MRSRAARIGAVLFALWGAVHVLGGGVLLRAALNGADRFLAAQSGRALPPLGRGDGAALASAVASQVFAFHAFNLVWLGALVFVLALVLNWRNSRAGLWLNGALVGFTDLGLVLFIVRPGVLGWAEAWIGPALFVPAIVASALGRLAPTPELHHLAKH